MMANLFLPYVQLKLQLPVLLVSLYETGCLLLLWHEIFFLYTSRFNKVKK